jgi:hypothetical protein
MQKILDVLAEMSADTNANWEERKAEWKACLV